MPLLTRPWAGRHRIGGEDPLVTLGKGDGDGIAHGEDDGIFIIGGGNSVVNRAVLQAQVVPGIAVHHGGTDLGDGAGDLALAGGGNIGIALINEAVAGQHETVIALAIRHRGTGGYNLILADIDHGVHLHQACCILQSHEIAGCRDVQKQGKVAV